MIGVPPSIVILTLDCRKRPWITHSHNKYRARLRLCSYISSIKLQTVSSEQNLSLYLLNSPLHSVHSKSCQLVVMYNILIINVTFFARCLKPHGLCEADRQAGQHRTLHSLIKKKNVSYKPSKLFMRNHVISQNPEGIKHQALYI